jgi:hypothetical protein
LSLRNRSSALDDIVLEAIRAAIAHRVLFAQSNLYRGAGLDVVWPQFLAVAVVGGLFFGLAILRFRSAAARST